MKKAIMLAIPVMLLLCAALLGGPAVGSAQAQPSTFPDVTETHTAFEAIETLAEDGIIAGTLTGEFLPDHPVTRGQAAKMLALWQEVESVTSATPTFPDVEAPTASYAEAVSAHDWMNGFPDGTFRPYDPLSRQQMVVIVVRSLGLEDDAAALDDSRVDQALAAFADDGAVSPSARPLMALAVMEGLIAGDGGRLHPSSPVTRAQFSLVVYRGNILEAGGQLPLVAPETDSAESVHAEGASEQTQSELNPTQRAQAAFMDTYLFKPRNSPISGEMVIQNEEWYGIPALSQLVIMAAETSLGDPKLGGSLARHYNFGCLRYHGSDTAWGALASDTIWVAGKDWYAFATPQIGMVAFGRYLKTGANGHYLPILTQTDPDWAGFAAVYYGRYVAGFSSYVDRLHTLEHRFRSMAAEQGVSL